MFQRYEDEFSELASEVGQKLKRVEQQPMTHDDAEEELDVVDELLGELRTVTRSMQMGKRDVAVAERPACERRLQEYQKDLERLTADLRRVRRNAAAKQGRTDLLGEGGGPGGGPLGAEAQRRADESRKLLDVAERGRSSLARTMAELEHTTSTGVATLENLKGQREQLGRSHDKLKQVDNNLDLSNKVLKVMERRAFTNKLIRYATIGILLLGILMMVWRIFTD